MIRLTGLADIAALYAARGHMRYGETVTQTQHATQCAGVAIATAASPALVAAALLHDIGHLIVGEAPNADRCHEVVGAASLAGLFGPAVCAPIALHVAAKRYLCATDPAYAAALSPASLRSLAVQGGAFDAAAASDFIVLPFAAEALTLRRWDDNGKLGDVTPRPFGELLALIAN